LNDKCADGACKGTAKDCDDDNICTLDSCDPASGCKHNGDSITTVGCSADKCGTGWKCAGDAAGTCVADSYTQCPNSPCGTGVCNPTDGSCSMTNVADNTDCDDGDACTIGEKCTGGVCGGGTTASCDDNNPCTTDTCTDSCHNVANTASCNDNNPCTINDACFGGQCAPSGHETPKTCAASDQCHAGMCNASNAGACDQVALTGNSCNDNNSCSASSTCQNGTCTPSGTFDACGAQATGCTAGNPNICTCNAGYHTSGGTCVPDTNECASNPCDPNATCSDPTGASNDYVCTCKPGYVGNGMLRNQLVCSTCADDETIVNNQCVCDMNGTFALKISMKMTWSGLAFGAIEDGTNVPFYTWALQSQTYDSSGNLHITSTPCGGTTPDLCSVPNPAFSLPAEAYGQYFPNHIWGTANMPQQIIDVALPDARATKAFVTANSAVLFGIRLTDAAGNPKPLGPWPANRLAVGCPTAGATTEPCIATTGSNLANKQCWNGGATCGYRTDDDGDGVTGITSLVVPPGGVNTDSPLNFGANSVDCRRSTTGTREPYVYYRALDNGPYVGVTKFYTASRTISRFEGTITSCDRIEGAVKGPRNSNKEIQADFRFYGCADDSADSVCSKYVLDDSAFGVDQQSQTSTSIPSASFVMIRVPDNTTCTQARGLTY
jgi:EGF domain-containing protein